MSRASIALVAIAALAAMPARRQYTYLPITTRTDYVFDSNGVLYATASAQMTRIRRAS